MSQNKGSVKLMMIKAEDKLKAAHQLIKSGFYDDAVSRAYYAVFHAVSSALFSKDLVFSSHGQTIGAFNKEFIKTTILPSDLSRKIQFLFDKRQIGDYDAGIKIERETADTAVEYAEVILKTIKSFIAKS